MIKYKFQHYVDIQTSASSLTMIQVKAGGVYAMQRTKHLYPAYKYAKLGNISVKLLPASTLPVDPLGLSYDANDPQTVDPRDQMNPGLVRITNGEDVLTDFSGLSDDQLEKMYVNTMLDPRWSKFMLQRGFSRHATPRYWEVGQLHQDMYPGAVVNVPGVSSSTVGDMTVHYVKDTTSVEHIDGAPTQADTYAAGTNMAYWNRHNSDGRGFFQTGHKGRLGWMPTDALEYFHDSDGTNFMHPMVNPLPSVNVITILLPKAHKTEYYYRMFITETVYFSGIKNTGINGENENEYRAIDNFMYAHFPIPSTPSTPQQDVNPYRYPETKNDGDMNW